MTRNIKSSWTNPRCFNVHAGERGNVLCIAKARNPRLKIPEMACRPGGVLKLRLRGESGNPKASG